MPRRSARQRLDPNQELVAHGPANILSGLFGGFLVVGSLSKTSVAIVAGARTQLANLVAALFCFLTLVLLTPLFRGMPHPALAAIVIAAMLHLSRPDYLRDLLARDRREFAIAAIVFVGELTLGVLDGIALGVALSLLVSRWEPAAPAPSTCGTRPNSTRRWRSFHALRHRGSGRRIGDSLRPSAQCRRLAHPACRVRRQTQRRHRAPIR
jgi:MFS superfamily sulfate permease-like transporter